ncbi:hypothetical protein GJQ55_01745 [Venatoribacter cucullus]|uniref:Porin domain-containing protein n=1 Tax=Venatoribacter cucullus TaxID=2661630 RepID=A0A9X7UWD0_9GAMM|nr:porin [Venatoribacter cucullus]QQD23273.1 hypothetical protein GJQ55_01745 [Venatoribacter cucullus]
MVLKKTGLAAAVLLAGSQLAYANDLNINGFINVTGGVLSNDKISLDGYDDNPSFDQGTLMGLQMSKKVNDSTSATVQLVSRGSEDYKTEASWAYITYALNNDTDIRAGRLRTPFFYYSDFLEVGYAFNWVRPPSSVYRLDGLSSITGVDITHRFNIGNVDGSVQVYTGRYNDDFALNGDTYEVELRNTLGAVFSLNQGNFGARVSYHQADLSFDAEAAATGRALDRLLFTATNFGVGTAFTPQEDQSKFYQASLTWDNGSTALIAEWTALKHDTAALLDDQAWLISAAQRYGDATVHLTYSVTEDDLKSGTVGTVQKFAENKDARIILGLRYDYDSSTALKFEVQHVDQDSASNRGDALKANPALGAAAANLPMDNNSGFLYTVGMSLVF